MYGFIMNFIWSHKPSSNPSFLLNQLNDPEQMSPESQVSLYLKQGSLKLPGSCQGLKMSV